ncbi:hypothetical protein M2459_002712 [Parabacteroides sp. PF5-5]|uniref:hypothetical protein n=1 Tax=unclassified Parabacteroides TaxID=2649774 RepID=UPI002474D418|nr:MULTISPECIES: hypothetical protein [unclassified Parabacteroides]MDH6305925.1 hypothetical protein [Parabacteroides sp. PH5-39]MDH6316860.1 hypothetical protein [Parabacteroides sp. PF5-13]MDH6320637.1 hypothetical protein [Parabacteroides sp. PH5-13]MDH6324442.1 hypothetical protein [Parabacteroides sp. PH5-8]MDH6328045.1 hypothetical protein [Parabacteroides sp. PH5-41]
MKKFKKERKTSVYSNIQRIRMRIKGQKVKTPEIYREVCEDVLPWNEREDFFTDFSKEKELLLDSKKISRECEVLNLNPEAVAQRVVFEGKKKMNEVLKNGLYSTFGEKIRAMGKPIFSEKDIQSYIQGDYSCSTDESQQHGFTPKESFIADAVSSQNIPSPAPFSASALISASLPTEESQK